MELKSSIKNAENFAYVGAQISNHFLRWFGQKSLEGMKFGADTSLAIASHGLRMVGKSGKKVVETAEQAVSVADGSTIAQQYALEKYQTTLKDTNGLLETASSHDVIQTVWKVRTNAALTYTDLCIQYGIKVDQRLKDKIISELMQGGTTDEQIKHVTQNLDVFTPEGIIIQSSAGLEPYVGRIDPSVPHDVELPRQVGYTDSLTN